MGMNLTPEDKLELFGGFDPDAHRGGDRAALGCHRRLPRVDATHRHLRQAGLAACAAGVRRSHGSVVGPGRRRAGRQPGRDGLRRGAPPADCRNFYTCTGEIHIGLAELYLADARFRAYYDTRRDGLAQFVHDAILANAVTGLT